MKDQINLIWQYDLENGRIVYIVLNTFSMCSHFITGIG